MGLEEIITTGVAVATKLSKDEGFQRIMLGTYADGKIKSLPDAILGETLSPKQKAKLAKKKKKKKKKKKDKKKYAKLHL
jgi:hypothetical protein